VENRTLEQKIVVGANVLCSASNGCKRVGQAVLSVRPEPVEGPFWHSHCGSTGSPRTEIPNTFDCTRQQPAGEEIGSNSCGRRFGVACKVGTRNPGRHSNVISGFRVPLRGPGMTVLEAYANTFAAFAGCVPRGVEKLISACPSRSSHRHLLRSSRRRRSGSSSLYHVLDSGLPRNDVLESGANPSLPASLPAL
jgi:hypothetical protein